MEPFDPLSDGFDVRNLNGKEKMLCRECGYIFNDPFGYADGIRNDDASPPKTPCCRAAMKSLIRQIWTMEADNMVVSDVPALREAGVKLRNMLHSNPDAQ
jgi:hypothetical protein